MDGVDILEEIPLSEDEVERLRNRRPNIGGWHGDHFGTVYLVKYDHTFCLDYAITDGNDFDFPPSPRPFKIGSVMEAFSDRHQCTILKYVL